MVHSLPTRFSSLCYWRYLSLSYWFLEVCVNVKDNWSFVIYVENTFQYALKFHVFKYHFPICFCLVFMLSKIFLTRKTDSYLPNVSSSPFMVYSFDSLLNLLGSNFGEAWSKKLTSYFPSQPMVSAPFIEWTFFAQWSFFSS